MKLDVPRSLLSNVLNDTLRGTTYMHILFTEILTQCAFVAFAIYSFRAYSIKSAGEKGGGISDDSPVCVVDDIFCDIWISTDPHGASA